jgi:hypothetical protein
VEVTSIDRNGEEVLAEIMRPRCEFISDDVYTKHLLRNLPSELKRSGVKGKKDRKTAARQSLMKPKELDYIHFGLAERTLREIVRDA